VKHTLAAFSRPFSKLRRSGALPREETPPVFYSGEGSGAEVRAVYDRIRFIIIEGKKILLVDFSDCAANESNRLLAQFLNM